MSQSRLAAALFPVVGFIVLAVGCSRGSLHPDGGAGGPAGGASGGASAGAGGTSAGTSGASAGTGGASAGTGGLAAGAGGTSAGTSGASAGTGGALGGRGGGAAGSAGGASAGRGGGGAAGSTGGSSAGRGGGGASAGRGGGAGGSTGGSSGGATGPDGGPKLTCRDPAEEVCTASIPPICSCDLGRPCPEAECSGTPPAATVCPDGRRLSAACVRDGNRQSCTWQPPACPPGALETAIQGWWSLGMNIGDCIQSASYFQFLPAGVAEEVLVDDNGCYPAMRGIFRMPASYQLAGTTLTLSQADRSRRMNRQQYDIATGTVGMTRYLYHRIFKPVDTVTWHAALATDAYDATGALTAHHMVSVDIRFASPLPTQGQGSCVANISYTVDGVTASRPSTACRYAPAGTLQGVEFTGFDFTTLSSAVSGQLLLVFGQWLYLNPADPTYLYRSGWPGLDATPARL